MTGARRLLAAALGGAVLLGSACTPEDEGDDMNASEARQRLHQETTHLVELLGGGKPEVAQDELLSCEMEGDDGTVYPTYKAGIAMVPDAITVLEEEVVPVMEEDGWSLRRRDSERYTSFDFDKDGFIVGASVPTEGNGTRIAVGGSGPCVAGVS